jgi:hypothetical protein
MSYATVSWRWKVYVFQATWRDGKIEGDRVTKVLLEEWSARSRGVNTSGPAAPPVRRGHLTTIPSFLGLVRLHADEVLSVETDYRDTFGTEERGVAF